MAQLLKFSSPVMRSRTGLNADDAPRRLAKEGQDLRPPQLPTDDHRAGCTNPVNLKNRLGDIQTNRCNLLHGWLLSIVIASTATTVWHLDAGGGAVHSIRSGHNCGRQTHRARAITLAQTSFPPNASACVADSVGSNGRPMDERNLTRVVSSLDSWVCLLYTSDAADDL